MFLNSLHMSTKYKISRVDKLVLLGFRLWAAQYNVLLISSARLQKNDGECFFLLSSINNKETIQRKHVHTDYKRAKTIIITNSLKKVAERKYT